MCLKIWRIMHLFSHLRKCQYKIFCMQKLIIVLKLRRLVCRNWFVSILKRFVGRNWFFFLKLVLEKPLLNKWRVIVYIITLLFIFSLWTVCTILVYMLSLQHYLSSVNFLHLLWIIGFTWELRLLYLFLYFIFSAKTHAFKHTIYCTVIEMSKMGSSNNG